MHAGIGEADRVHKVAGGILTQYWFSIALSRIRADALGGHNPNFRDLVEKVLNDRGGGRHDSGRNGKGPGKSFAEEVQVSVLRWGRLRRAIIGLAWA